MSSRRIPRWAVATLLTIPAFGAGLAVSAAASGSSSKTFYACLHDGSLSKVSTSSHSCPKGSSKESWNAVGSQGTQGVQGIPGLKGVTGSRGPDGASGAPGAAGPGAQYFTSSGTYMVPIGVTQVQIVVVGGGGGGGNTDLAGDPGSGGGQGASEAVLADVVAGTSLTVTAGQGGGMGVAECDYVFPGGNGSASEVADGAIVLAYAGGGTGGGSGDWCTSIGPGGPGGTATIESGVTTVSETPGAAGTAGTQGDPGGGGPGGAVPGIAGSGGQGADTDGDGSGGWGGYVEIIPN